MSETVALEQRIQNLEIHLANQESTVQDLSDAVAGQWEVIDKLSQGIETLKSRLLNMEETIQQGPREEEKPPHY